jgi:hypothetical protein
MNSGMIANGYIGQILLAPVQTLEATHPNTVEPQIFGPSLISSSNRKKKESANKFRK